VWTYKHGSHRAWAEKKVEPAGEGKGLKTKGEKKRENPERLPNANETILGGKQLKVNVKEKTKATMKVKRGQN